MITHPAETCSLPGQHFTSGGNGEWHNANSVVICRDETAPRRARGSMLCAHWMRAGRERTRRNETWRPEALQTVELMLCVRK